MPTSIFQNQNVLITGGSTGIGFAIAQQLGAKGAKLHLLARTRSKLERAKAQLAEEGITNVAIYDCDVTDEAGIRAIVQQIGESEVGLHTLINNAGTDIFGRFTDSEIGRKKEVMDINYWGAAFPTHVAIPYLKKSKNARLAFVGSVAGYLGAIGYSSYAPTKFAMTGLAECLRMELAPFDVTTTIVFPPDTDTPLYEYEKLHTLPETAALSKNAKVLQPEFVAQKLIRGMEKGQFEVLCNLESRVLKVLKNLWPKLHYRILDEIVARATKN